MTTMTGTIVDLDGFVRSIPTEELREMFSDPDGRYEPALLGAQALEWATSLCSNLEVPDLQLLLADTKQEVLTYRFYGQLVALIGLQLPWSDDNLNALYLIGLSIVLVAMSTEARRLSAR